jgi:hypothetical protein
MKAVVIAVLVIVSLIAIPAIALWTLNSLAEAGGSSFYIAHNVWNYWVAFVAVCILKGTTSYSNN